MATLFSIDSAHILAFSLYTTPDFASSAYYAPLYAPSFISSASRYQSTLCTQSASAPSDAAALQNSSYLKMLIKSQAYALGLRVKDEVKQEVLKKLKNSANPAALKNSSYLKMMITSKAYSL